MKKILLLITIASLFLACNDQMAEEAKNQAAEKFTLKLIYDRTRGDKGFDRGDFDGFLLPIGTKRTINVAKNNDGSILIDYNDNMAQEITVGPRTDITATWFNTNEYFESSTSTQYVVAKTYAANVANNRWYISDKKIIDSDYLFTGWPKYSNDNLFTFTIPADDTNFDFTVNGPAARISIAVWHYLGSKGADSRMTDIDPGYEYVKYVWKGFWNGFGKMEVQMVGYMYNDKGYGDSNFGASYVPIAEP